jgi:cell division protein FtsB
MSEPVPPADDPVDLACQWAALQMQIEEQQRRLLGTRARLEQLHAEADDLQERIDAYKRRPR